MENPFKSSNPMTLIKHRYSTNAFRYFQPTSEFEIDRPMVDDTDQN